MEQIVHSHRAHGLATVLAIGTAVPPACVPHDTYADFYFRITNSDHLTELKERMAKICKSTTIQQRYMGMMAKDGEMLKKWPNIAKHSEPSLDARWEILAEEVPKQAKESAMAAIKEWGQPMSKLTHLIFCTNSGADCPGADCCLVHLLGLPTTVKRIMLYYQGCHGGATAMRLAKDFTENNCGACVLVVTCEYTLHAFRGPSESNPDDLIVQALFGDGSASLIVGADPDFNVERPLFELVSTRQTMILNTMEDKIQLREVGNLITIAPSFAKHISENIRDCVEEALKPLGITDLNSLFWIVHPGGPKTLKVIEEKLKLNKEKLETTKKVLANVGNLSSPTELFIMDEMRKKSIEERKKSTTRDGLDFGMLIGYGPGISIETIVLRSVPV